MSEHEASAGAPIGDSGATNDSNTQPAADTELQPTLERATQTLAAALDQACAADIDRIDTGELIRVEEMLAIANEAAKEVISVRRRLHRSHPGQRMSSTSTERSATSSDVTSSRTLVDNDGRQWTVFAVYPSSTRGRSVLREGFANGWLSFDAGDETRRLAPIPEAWDQLPDLALLEMCAGAESSRPRRQSRDQRPRADQAE